MNTTEQKTETAIVEQPTSNPGALTDALTLDEMRQAIKDYRALQRMLDEEMPDQIQEIRHKNNKTGEMEISRHRKKGYWRAVAKYFRIKTEIISEKEIKRPDGDTGFLIVVRATAPNGDYADGDGAVFASEKKYESGRTVHNLRSHAVTRASGRAISNLAGFGEVTAEEINDQERGVIDVPAKVVQEPAKNGAKPHPWSGPLDGGGSK